MIANDSAPPSRLEVRGVEKSFPGVRALSGVSFDLQPGEVHALLGENGAGKSTLIKIMSGVYRPDAGSIFVDGRETKLDTPDDARRAGIATIYQELLLFPDLSVAENIFIGHAPKRGLGRIDLTGDARARPGVDLLARNRRSACRRHGGHAFRRQPPARRNSARAFARSARADHGRADSGAD